MDLQKIGACLRDLRKDKGLTQAQLAERFHVSGKTVSRWENGVHMPDLELLLELADFYEVDLRALLKGERLPAEAAQETKETVKAAAKYSKAKSSQDVEEIYKHAVLQYRRTETVKNTIKTVFFGILSIILLLIIFHWAYAICLPEMKDGYLNSYRYRSAPQYEAVQIQQFPIAREDGFGYFMIPLKNDPERLFLYPRPFLRLNRYLVARTDAELPDPARHSVNSVTISGKTLDRTAQEALLSVFCGDHSSSFDGSPYQYGTVINHYSVIITFKDFSQVFYRTWIAEYQMEYGLVIYDREGKEQIVILDKTIAETIGLSVPDETKIE